MRSWSSRRPASATGGPTRPSVRCGSVGFVQVAGIDRAPHADGLWRHTCCEAFLAERGRPGYHEFSFAPSTEGAVYRFAAYRAGMTVVEPLEDRPSIRAPARAGSNRRLACSSPNRQPNRAARSCGWPCPPRVRRHRRAKRPMLASGVAASAGSTGFLSPPTQIIRP